MPIRLLFLSVEDIRYALRCMNVSELIAFSLCSKRTKNLAKSSNRIIELIEAEVFENRIRLGVEDDWDQDDPDQDDPHNEFISLDLSDSFINIDRGNGIEVWRKQGFTLSNWIAHFLSIFNKEMVHMFIINDVSLSYLGTIKQLIPKCQKLKISQFCSNDVAKVAFRKLISIAERVVIDKNIFDDENDISGYLTPNLRSLSFLDVENPFKLTVNDLLVLNIANLSIETANITVKEMNRFIKLWMKGSHEQDFQDLLDNEFVSFDLFDSFITIDHGYGIEFWRKQEFTQSDWIAHFLSIFNEAMVHLLVINNVSLPFLDTVKQLIPKCQQLRISQFCPNDVAKIAFRKLSSISEEVTIQKNIFANEDNDFSNLLSRNLKSASIGVGRNAFQLTVNDLLALNITDLTIDKANITGKELNRFLKVWMKRSHTFYRPKIIRLMFDNEIHQNRQKVFEGIKYQIVDYECILKRRDGKELMVDVKDSSIVFRFE
ncbi:hypothetical protein B9Z55_021574 [Caenorhabditis nigoni]|uniref:F-box domain-containing protein n=1 Tax=Caenorhabditis nigoni TaxID=1611254 RepID=A0A2G5TSL7_9PELO|nr:hypothetical protein B9Z55_021574 [Caenorhabditis nigoni]